MLLNSVWFKCRRVLLFGPLMYSINSDTLCVCCFIFSYVRTTNTKNSPADLNKLIQRYSPHIKTWTPVPGSIMDLQKVLQGDRYVVGMPGKNTIFPGNIIKMFAPKFFWDSMSVGHFYIHVQKKTNNSPKIAKMSIQQAKVLVKERPCFIYPCLMT